MKDSAKPGAKILQFRLKVNTPTPKWPTHRGMPILQTSDKEFGQRMIRIRQSLEAVNKLMAELKKQEAEADK